MPVPVLEVALVPAFALEHVFVTQIELVVVVKDLAVETAKVHHLVVFAGLVVLDELVALVVQGVLVVLVVLALLVTLVVVGN